MLYEITLTTPDFKGTLQVLIERVRRYEINILDVRLSPIARQVAHIMTNSDNYDFTPCTAMAGLMFVKSRALLPWQNPLDEPELDDIGTMKTIALGTSAAGNLRAKTGNHLRVCAHTGYVYSKNGDLICFSMIANNYLNSYRKMRRRHEQLMIGLAELP